jgi:hypothetical protein
MSDPKILLNLHRASLCDKVPACSDSETVTLSFKVSNLTPLDIRHSLHRALGARIKGYGLSCDTHPCCLLELYIPRSQIDVFVQQVIQCFPTAEFRGLSCERGHPAPFHAD